MTVVGTTHAAIVTDPANAATVKTALDTAVAAVGSISGSIQVTSMGQGKAILVTGVQVLA